MSAVTYPLPDGSTVEVDRRDHNRSLISRYVDGECVWGQSFSCGPREDHGAQVAEIVADMASRPSDFSRWWNTTDGSSSAAFPARLAADRDPAGSPRSLAGSHPPVRTRTTPPPSTPIPGLVVSSPHPSRTGSERGTLRMGSTTAFTHTRNAPAAGATARGQ